MMLCWLVAARTISIRSNHHIHWCCTTKSRKTKPSILQNQHFWMRNSKFSDWVWIRVLLLWTFSVWSISLNRTTSNIIFISINNYNKVHSCIKTVCRWTWIKPPPFTTAAMWISKGTHGLVLDGRNRHFIALKWCGLRERILIGMKSALWRHYLGLRKGCFHCQKYYGVVRYSK